ncbi:GNAT family N-acetyltransferase [Dipodascopsis tothii]|uniref:GNAT family N-acetyltransferase n=1 Tax=Dipodascopsis tothii TaxID=44089 RepID=UPI0034CD676A
MASASKDYSAVIIQTPRLTLRPLSVADAPAWLQIMQDPDVLRYWSHGPWKDEDEAETAIKADMAALERGEYLKLAIVENETKRLAGMCLLFGVHEASRRCWIGFCLANQFWGKGYMTEALTGFLDYAHKILAMRRFEADTDPNNTRCQAVLERMGFEREGLLRERWLVDGEVKDALIYGLVKRDS